MYRKLAALVLAAALPTLLVYVLAGRYFLLLMQRSSVYIFMV